ncbi:helix-turn-helix domain-containing protein [Lipingzhangella sp. LS1_29]|uniref:Helix-turn-helix domain-containing protein n=1 Tax=Lipingzhangella rawalii TaxID=2055835 RepID=A0ABU2H770_9ACTN|nr:helix-turn-helix domain-containing protein [Lipingzhangella rawalii]MDS1270827.1 helix-turn-helix domain-containing protein [Lipingzhangella rawalii]
MAESAASAPSPRPEARGTLGTVRNAVALLDLLSDGPAYQHLNDLSERSGLSVATAHRLLRSLVLADLVEQDPRTSRYGLGPGVTRLSERYLGRLPVLGALAPYLVRLRDATGHTIQVALLVRGSVVYVDRVDGADGGLYREAHRVRPALSTAAGRILAAGAEDVAWGQALETAEPELREQGEKERDTWRQAPYLCLAATEAGMAGSVLSQPEPLEVAVGVPDSSGRPVAALAVTPDELPQDRIEPLARQLVQAATAAGRTLSHG